MRYYGRTMNRLRIIPLDDTVVFPGMPVTLPVDVGSDDRVLLVPRQRQHLREGRRRRGSVRARAARRPRARRVADWRSTARSPARAAADADGVLRVDVEAASGPGAAGQPDPRARARVPRRRRRDSRAARRRRPDPRVRAIDHRAGRAGRHRRLLAGSELRAEARSCSKRSTSSSG